MAKYYLPQQVVGMRRNGSLINIKPSVFSMPFQMLQLLLEYNYSSFLGTMGVQIRRATSQQFTAFVDPRGQPTVTAGSDNYFRTCRLYVLLSVFSQSRKTKLQLK